MHQSVGLLPFFLNMYIILSFVVIVVKREKLVYECPLYKYVVWQDLHQGNTEQLAMWACLFKVVKVGGAS